MEKHSNKSYFTLEQKCEIEELARKQFVKLILQQKNKEETRTGKWMEQPIGSSNIIYQNTADYQR